MQSDFGRSMQKCIDQLGSHFSHTFLVSFQFPLGRGTSAAGNPMTNFFFMLESSMDEFTSTSDKATNTQRHTFENAASTARRAANEAAGDITEAVDNTVQVDTKSCTRSPSGSSNGHDSQTDHNDNGNLNSEHGSERAAEDKCSPSGQGKRK